MEGRKERDEERNYKRQKSQKIEWLWIPKDLHWGQDSSQYVRDAMKTGDCAEGDS